MYYRKVYFEQRRQQVHGLLPMVVNKVDELMKFWNDDQFCFLGVVKHVGDALCAKSPKAKSDIVCIGFSPWGVIEGRENLIGVNVSGGEDLDQ